MVEGKGDGRADDTAALQAAIDAAAKPGGGLVFLPSGRYRISKTLFLVAWRAGVPGVGATRPEIVLGDATPGFQKGLANMVIVAGAKPDPASPRGSSGRRAAVPFNKRCHGRQFRHLLHRDEQHRLQNRAGQSGGDGDPVPRRPARLPQSHDLRHWLGPGGLYQIGNEAEDLHFKGGRYGILTEKPSPAWALALLDSTFEGQRRGGDPRARGAGLTLVNVTPGDDTPVGIDIDRGYGDWLWRARTSVSRTFRKGGRHRFRTNATSTPKSASRTHRRKHPGVRALPASAARPRPARARPKVAASATASTLARPGPDGRLQDHREGRDHRRLAVKTRDPAIRALPAQRPSGQTSGRSEPRATMSATTPPPSRRRSTTTVWLFASRPDSHRSPTR
ncbi:glycosyl hydrolase family 28-related protein [Caulobacter segnis]